MTSSLWQRRSMRSMKLNPIFPTKSRDDLMLRCETGTTTPGTATTISLLSTMSISISSERGDEGYRHEMIQRSFCETPSDEPEIETSDEWPPRQSFALGEYDLLEVLGSGSCGRVWKAKRKTDDTHVAVKVMHARDANEFVERAAEYNLLQRLSHPHIVGVMDFFHQDHLAVLVMSFHEGSTLDVAVKTSPCKFSEDVSRKLFGQLLSAVSYLHGLEVIHRDIKAQNVCISSDQTTLHLLDFNVAKALSDGIPLTMTGTQEYAAPEVLDGGSPSSKQDVWSMGLCLHIMLTGRLPRRSDHYISLEDFATAMKRQPVKWNKTCWESVSKECKRVLAQCLITSEDQRPEACTLFAMSWMQM